MTNNLIKIFVLFIILGTLNLRCTYRLTTLNQKAIQKCKHCRDFLEKYQQIDLPNIPYDSYIFDSHAIPLIDIDTLPDFEKARYQLQQDSIKSTWKDHILLVDDFNKLIQNQWCFNGLTKANIEKRFGLGFKKRFDLEYSGLSLPNANPERCFLSYDFTTGIYNNNQSNPIASDISSGFLFFTFEIMKGDTTCNMGVSNIHLLKQCFEAEGLKYIDNLDK